MEALSKLTPAETYLIKDRKKLKYRELLKYTLIHLMVKKVLITYEEELQSNENDPVRTISHVKVGPNFKSHEFQQHELIFAQPFLDDNELEISFKNLVKIGFEKAGSYKSFIFDRLHASPFVSKSITSGFWSRLFVYVSLTDDGKMLKKKIEQELAELEKKLPGMIESDPEGVKKIIGQIGGNVFLVSTLDYTLLAKIDEELGKEMKKQKDADGGCSGCFIYFGDYSSDFDSGFSDAGGSDGCGSGCGSSGCGGGGCGGCGGCGG